MATRHSLTRDPVYYSTLVIFAVLVTVIPTFSRAGAAVTDLQALFLTAFAWLPVRQKDLRSALIVVAAWLAIQFLTILTLSMLSPSFMERIFSDGFTIRGGIMGWQLGQAPYPGSLLDNPATRLIEIVGSMLGSLASAGLVGYWFLVRAVNLLAYQIGVLASSRAETDASMLIALPFWAFLRIGGMALLTLLCSLPLIAGARGIDQLIDRFRRYWLVAATMLLAGIVAEVALAGLWRTLFG